MDGYEDLEHFDTQALVIEARSRLQEVQGIAQNTILADVAEIAEELLPTLMENARFTKMVEALKDVGPGRVTEEYQNAIAPLLPEEYSPQVSHRTATVTSIQEIREEEPVREGVPINRPGLHNLLSMQEQGDNVPILASVSPSRNSIPFTSGFRFYENNADSKRESEPIIISSLDIIPEGYEVPTGNPGCLPHYPKQEFLDKEYLKEPGKSSKRDSYLKTGLKLSALVITTAAVVFVLSAHEAVKVLKGLMKIFL
jgi:hypothetical protein